ncbi:MAG: hypothetical protein H0T54_05035 [Geodermatophilaceae bacterium]|nr:hypothetical protein [Geodermatophilaceae bacterium]
MNAPAARRWTTQGRGSIIEIVIAGIAAVMIMLEIWVFDPGGFTAGRTIAGLTAAVSLCFLRQAPFAAYVANGLALYALTALGFSSDYYQWTNLVAIIAVASRASLPKAVLSLGMSYVGISFYFLRFPDEGPPALAGAVLAFWTAAFFAGRAQLARARVAEARQQNQLARAELAAQQARADLEAERSRIAHELHDVVGHAVNVMVVHAGAGQGLACSDESAPEIFRTIAATGRTALADLDRMLDVLHGNAQRDPLPGLDQLETLCRAIRSTGLDVDLSVADTAKAVSPSLALAIYRIVQEGLTNVIKHARATSVRVDVAVADEGSDETGTEVLITVRDNGSGGQPVPGRGLGGIAARAALHHGSVRYGTGPDGGFELAVSLAEGAAT